MSAQTLTLLNLYPRQMNTYGDRGNVLVLKRRCEWRDITLKIVSFNLGDTAQLFSDVDLIFSGGGQDSGQTLVQPDLLRIAPLLKERIERETPALLVCGSFQLFGRYLKTAEAGILEGVGLFDMHTVATNKRCSGNIIVKNSIFGELVGYENHLGRTYLGKDLEPFAQLISGFGNNGEDGTEGARHKNALGTYLHGPLLPKNPQVADHLITRALDNRYGTGAKLKPLKDQWVEPARTAAKSRPQ